MAYRGISSVGIGYVYGFTFGDRFLIVAEYQGSPISSSEIIANIGGWTKGACNGYCVATAQNGTVNTVGLAVDSNGDVFHTSGTARISLRGAIIA